MNDHYNEILEKIEYLDECLNQSSSLYLQAFQIGEIIKERDELSEELYELLCEEK